ncbi:MAG: right-handed parallel beta-helix repeat-containing protein [Nitrososphaeraceae archaeon]
MKRSLTVTIVAIVLGLMLMPTSMNLQTSNAASLITVPRDYPTIQSAIDAASPGDTIKVLPGTYAEQLTIGKSLTLVGSGAKATVIRAPAVLDTNILGLTYITQINGGATVNMKGFTVDAGSSCDVFFGLTVFDSATLNLDTSVITGCYQVGVIAGSTMTPGGPQTGHVTVTRTDVNGYLNQGIIARGPPGTTLEVSYSTITAAAGSPIDGQAGITEFSGAKVNIHHNKVSLNLCDNPACGPDFLTQLQGFGIFVDSAAQGSVISYNDVSNNDGGIAVGGNSGCCKVDHNILTNSRFFGIVVYDGEHIISNTKISGGNVGVLAVAFGVDTVATLDRVIITGTTTPTQELSVGATAEVVFAPRSVLTTQSTTLTSNPISFVLPTPDYAELSYQGEVAGG